MADLPATDTQDAQDTEQPWQRLNTESNLWFSRFLLFKDLGPGRKVLQAYRAELEREKVSQAEIEHKAIRTPKGWLEARDKYKWYERAEAWDEYQRKHVFTSGYAYEPNRVKKLNQLLEKMEERVTQMFLVAKPAKGINFEFLKLYLDTVEAIAKETGGRVVRKELSGPQGGAINVVLYTPEQEPDELPGELEDITEGAEDGEEWQ